MLVTSTAVSMFRDGIRWPFFVNQSTNVVILSNPRKGFGKWMIKFIAMLLQRRSETSKVWVDPSGLALPFLWVWSVRQPNEYACIFYDLLHKYEWRLGRVLDSEKCPKSLLSWARQRIFWIFFWGTQNYRSYIRRPLCRKDCRRRDLTLTACVSFSGRKPRRAVKIGANVLSKRSSSGNLSGRLNFSCSILIWLRSAASSLMTWGVLIDVSPSTWTFSFTKYIKNILHGPIKASRLASWRLGLFSEIRFYNFIISQNFKFSSFQIISETFLKIDYPKKLSVFVQLIFFAVDNRLEKRCNRLISPAAPTSVSVPPTVCAEACTWHLKKIFSVGLP